MSDRVEYIRRRLDELEAAAKAAAMSIALSIVPEALVEEESDEHMATASRWSVKPWLFSKQVYVQSRWGTKEIASWGAEHIALNDPAAVLARVAADRKMLASHYDYTGVCTRCFDFQNKPVEREPFPCEVVRLLAEGLGWRDGSDE